MKQRSYRSRQHNKLHIMPSIALALAVAGGGVALSVYQTHKQGSPLSSAIQKIDEKSGVLPTHLDGIVPITALNELVADKSDSLTTNITLENQDGLLTYVFTLSDGTAHGFSATSGSAIVLKSDSNIQDQQKGDALPDSFKVNTSFEEARQLAQTAFPNNTIRNIQLTNDAGVIMLSAMFTDKAQVSINVENGTVMRITTPTGAIAEAPSDTQPLPTLPSEDSSTPSPDTPETNANPAPDPASKNTAPRDKDSSNIITGKATVQIQGTLTLANGIYTVTDNGLTYTLVTDQEIKSLVDQTVRVDGKLQDSNLIKMTKIKPLR